MPDNDTFAVILIRRIDGETEPSFGYRACAVRSMVADLLVRCDVAGVAWFGIPTRREAHELLNEAKQLWR